MATPTELEVTEATRLSINVWTFAQDAGSVLNPVTGSAVIVRFFVLSWFVIAFLE